jgi:hypothetical protein
MRLSPTLLRKRFETYTHLRLLHLVTNQNRRRRQGKGRLKTISRHLRDGIEEIAPKADLVLWKRVHLVPRDPIKISRIVVGVEMIHLELERFQAVVAVQPFRINTVLNYQPFRPFRMQIVPKSQPLLSLARAGGGGKPL